MIEYPKEFLEALDKAMRSYDGHLTNGSFMSTLDIIHNFVNGKYGPINIGIPSCPKCKTEKLSCRNGCTWPINPT